MTAGKHHILYSLRTETDPGLIQSRSGLREVFWVVFFSILSEF